MPTLLELNKNPVYFHGVSHLVELFPAPIPTVIETENGECEIEGASDLMQMSHWFGTTELYLPSGPTVTAKTEDEELEISAEDFIRFQLEKATPETLYYIINKTDADPDVAEILDGDAEYEKDENYDPETWLIEYDEDSLEDGVAFVARLKREEPDALFEILANCCLDADTGLANWLETEISDDFELRHGYDEWDVRIAVVFEGDFIPYASEGWAAADHLSPLSLDHWTVKRIYVRNHDEG
jgi:transcriptional regulator with XRE-family HTH domain